MNTGRIPAMVNALGNKYVNAIVPGSGPIKNKRQDLIRKLNDPAFHGRFVNQWEKMIGKTNASRRDADMEQFRNPIATKTGKMTQKDTRFYKMIKDSLEHEAEKIKNDYVKSAPELANPASRPVMNGILKTILGFGAVAVQSPYGGFRIRPMKIASHFIPTIALYFAQPMLTGTIAPLKYFGMIEWMLKSKDYLNMAAHYIDPVSIGLLTDAINLYHNYMGLAGAGRRAWVRQNTKMIMSVTFRVILLLYLFDATRRAGGPAAFLAMLTANFGVAIGTRVFNSYVRKYYGNAISYILDYGMIDVSDEPLGGSFTQPDEDWDLMDTLKLTWHMLIHPRSTGMKMWFSMIATGGLVMHSIRASTRMVLKFKNFDRIQAALEYNERKNKQRKLKENKAKEADEKKTIELREKATKKRNSMIRHFNRRKENKLTNTDNAILRKNISKVTNINAHMKSLNEIYIRHRPPRWFFSR
jgi:hypothetical protein